MSAFCFVMEECSLMNPVVSFTFGALLFKRDLLRFFVNGFSFQLVVIKLLALADKVTVF